MARLNHTPLLSRLIAVAMGLLGVGCGGPQGDEPLAPDGTPPDCDNDTYPAGEVEPMALGETLTPYAWPDAENLRSGQRADLDLGTVPCDIDDDIDWSPFDVLLFISVPAW